MTLVEEANDNNEWIYKAGSVGPCHSCKVWANSLPLSLAELQLEVARAASWMDSCFMSVCWEDTKERFH